MVVYQTRQKELPRPRPGHSSLTRRPDTKLGQFFWRKRIWIESTFALTVYEPWEKVVVISVFAVLWVAITTVIFKYLPRQLIIMRRRALYYLFGAEVDETLLWQYLGLAYTK
ncbi:hypothetical protein D9619_010491 [Psilocybe cf. subviscida]|uniref:Uncharacterized protein n=1 Tax=Psilocybe cf. subviscida TaxID=2480587 RepID=A0A8H5ASV8_9AGAR|nr:hypothetical protein D9619_010491 [Psilocybe cf. subviscida]